MESKKNGSEEWSNGETDMAVMEKQTWRIDMGRGEEWVRYMERVTWKLTLQYVKYIANRNLLCGSRNSNRGSVSI